MKFKLSIIIGMFLFLSAVLAGAEEITENKVTTPKVESSEQTIVYYLHMNRRCMTCEKLESYSQEAIEAGFAEQLKDSSIVYKVLNFEVEGNEHFAKDYKLFSQSVVISHQVDGEETKWKNLDKIWELVHDKKEFIAYVQTELKEFKKSLESK